MTRATWLRNSTAVTHLLLGVLLLPVLLVACSDNKSNKGPRFGAAITGTSTGGAFLITITINPNNVEPGQQAGITVVVATFNGAPIAGRPVQLSTSGGRLSTVSGTTDPAGKFVAFITVDAPGGGNTPGNIPATVTITATVDGLSASAILTIGAPAGLSITPGGPVTLSPGQAQTFTAAGGIEPYRWTATGGTLNTCCVPTVTYTAGTAVGNFSITVTDARGNSASATIVISGTVAGALTVSPASVTLSPGQAQIFQASGGVPGYRWSFPGNAGTLSTTSGPTTTLTAGTTSGTFNLLLTDSLGQAVSAAVTIQVSALKISPTQVAFTQQAPGTTKPGTCGTVAFTRTLTITGGVPPYSVSAFGPGTATLTGSNTVTYTFSQVMTGGTIIQDTVTVTDSAGTLVSASITVTCTPPA